MSHQSVTSLLQESEGAVLIEFVLVLPLLLLVIVGIFDFGFAFQEYAVVTNAAREGARMAVLPGYDTADVKKRVAAYLIAGGVTTTPSTNVDLMAPDDTQPFNAKKVTVEIDYRFNYLTPFAKVFGTTKATVTLKAVSVMRVEVAAEAP